MNENNEESGTQIPQTHCKIDPPVQCGRCGTDTVEVTLPDGQLIGWYCGDCHAVTTSDGGLATFEHEVSGDE